MRTMWLSISVLLFICSACPVSKSHDHKQESYAKGFEYTLLFYNVENLFHPSDDSISGDDPFTPVGERYWTYKKYRKKISAICKVILAAGGWEPPDFIGLCELENEKVIKDLIFHPLLIDYNYKYIHRNSPDHRGIDVALLYRTDRLSCLSHGFIKNDLPGRNTGTRDILHGEFAATTDTLHIFVNHWVSKYGGIYETEKLRLYQAKLLSGVIDSLAFNNTANKFIITGDFNDNSHSSSIKQLCQTGLIQEVPPQNGRCTYKYHGKWDLIDHIFIAGPWSESAVSTEVFAKEYLLEEDASYTDMKPFRTYTGFSYNGGVSDHLPLLFHFDLREEPGD